MDTASGTVTVAPGIDLAYETFGSADDPTILLVMGLGTQMIAWPDELCEALADAGHHVVRFDNRDIGGSTHLDVPPPPLGKMLLKHDVPYTLDDMAADAVALLDALGVERFHVVGASMGGFISQTIALAHPARVRSLTLIMTSTGSRRVGRPTPAVMRRLAKQRTITSREEAIELAVEVYGVIGSPAHLDEAHIREVAGRSWDRANDSEGRQRQLAAILAQPDRTRALRGLRMPTLIVHGLADPLVSATGGLALAKAIPGATFVGYQGMGHDLPRTRWDDLVAHVLALVARAE